jgi:general secretion pathway protein N
MSNHFRFAWVALGVLFAGLALLMLMPLGVAASSFGLAARHSQGTIMSGALRDAALGRIRIGDVNVKLQPLALLKGQVQFALQRGDAPDAPGLSGSIGSGYSSAFVDRLTASVDGGGLIDGMDGSDVRVESLSVNFSHGRCISASGLVRLSLDDTPLGSAIKGGLAGNAECRNGDLFLPLFSASAMERVFVRIKGDGRYQATITVSEPSPETTTALGFAGFQPMAGGLRLTRSGRLN